MRHGFGYFFERHKLTDSCPGAGTARGRRRAAVARGRHLREMLDELGPTFVKFGQLLSTRPDVVPPDIIAELRGLQDDVRPFPYEEVERVIREELGQPIERLFLEFDPSPLAAASIGQVHRAVLPNGRTSSPSRCSGRARRSRSRPTSSCSTRLRGSSKERVRALDFIDVREIVDEFARSIRQELDYRLEGRNAERLPRNFAGHPHVAVPRVYWSYTRARVLTLEYLEGVQLADLELDGWSLEQRRRLA